MVRAPRDPARANGGVLRAFLRQPDDIKVVVQFAEA
jgi:hypothetical protein